ncbi:hypothetical protein ACFV23_18545 [Streptomyces sp. NPDC059627]
MKTCQYADDYVRYYRRGTCTCPAQNYFFQGDPKTRTQWLSPSLATFRKALAPWVNASRSWCGRS